MDNKSLVIITEVDFKETIKINRKYTPKENVSIYLKEGQLDIQVNGKDYQIWPNTLFFLNKGAVYSVSSFESIQLFMLEVDSKLNSDLLLGFNKYEAYQNQQQLDKGLKLDVVEFDVIWKHLQTINHYYQKEVGSGFRDRILQSLYMALIYMVVEEIFDSKNRVPSKNNRKESITIEFLNAIEKDFKSQRELQYYADKLNLSLKYISNCVRETTGSAPRDLIAATTMTFAKNQLTQTAESIEQISESLHFSDVYSFGKFFKKHSGFSPGKFRKLLQ